MSRPTLVKVVGAVLASAFVLVGTGCTRENNNAAPGVGGGEPNSRTPCASSADCGGGQVCTTIGCCPGCHADADCGAGQACVSGAPNFCAPKDMTPTPTMAGPGPIAATPPNPVAELPASTACFGDGECLLNKVCVVGKCVAACSGDSCGAGQQCVLGRCYASTGVTCGTAALTLCHSTAECGAGRSCHNGACLSACAQNADCGLGQLCANSYCQADARPVASQCTFDNDCGIAFRCINAYCHPLCSTDDQCGAKNLCDHGVCRANLLPAG